MHSIEQFEANVPAFLGKLWKMVEDPDINDLITWSPGGASFFIKNQARFSRELLPLYYKHNNMASFVRQLNMYGFHKVVSIESGGMKIDKDEMEFAHPCFVLGHPYLLAHIKRKIPSTKTEDGRPGNKPELVTKVLSEVKSLKGRQDSVDSQLHSMKRENEVLWREVAILRQKHRKQQQIVNKLIQFLVSMVQPSRASGLGIKRHYPLMLSDTIHRARKNAKLNGHLSDTESVPNLSPRGPVIHELDQADLLEDYVPGNDDSTGNADFLKTNNVGDATSPVSSERLNHPSPNALLELAEEYPMSPGMPTSSPASPRGQRKGGRGRRNHGMRGGRKRQVKVTATTHSNEPVATEENSRDADEPLNVGNFLEIVMPTMVSAEEVADLNVLDKDLAEGAVVPEGTFSQDATKATSTTIRNVSTGKMLTDDPSSNDLSNNDLSNNLLTSDLIPLANGPINNLLVFDPNTPLVIDPANTPLVIDPANTPLVIDPTNTSLVIDPTNTPLVLDPTNTPLVSGASKKNLMTNVKSSSNSRSDQFNNPLHEISKDSPSVNDQSNSDPSSNETSRNNASNSSTDMAVACTSSSLENTGMKRRSLSGDLDSQLDNMQTELDTLKELLKSDGYSLDANTLLGLFGDDPISYGIPMMQEGASEQNKENGVAGNELMAYSSSLLDLGDMFDDQTTEDWILPDDGPSNLEKESTDLDTPQITMLNNPDFSGAVTSAKKKTK